MISKSNSILYTVRNLILFKSLERLSNEIKTYFWKFILAKKDLFSKCFKHPSRASHGIVVIYVVNWVKKTGLLFCSAEYRQTFCKKHFFKLKEFQKKLVPLKFQKTYVYDHCDSSRL